MLLQKLQHAIFLGKLVGTDWVGGDREGPIAPQRSQGGDRSSSLQRELGLTLLRLHWFILAWRGGGLASLYGGGAPRLSRGRSRIVSLGRSCL
jgi:hypothetical protein